MLVPEAWPHCLGQRLVAEEPANVSGECPSLEPACHMGASGAGVLGTARTRRAKGRADEGVRLPTHWVNGARSEF